MRLISWQHHNDDYFTCLKCYARINPLDVVEVVESSSSREPRLRCGECALNAYVVHIGLEEDNIRRIVSDELKRLLRQEVPDPDFAKE